MRRVLVLVLLAAAAAAGEAAGEFRFVETVSGPADGRIDPEAARVLAAHHRDRLARARAELATAPPAIARLLRGDIGAIEAELARLAVAGGGALVVGRRTYRLAPGRVAVEGDGVRIEVDTAARRGTVFAGGAAEGAPVAMAPPPEAVPAARGVPAGELRGRQVLRFSFQAEGRTFTVLVDPTLLNPLAHLIPAEGEAAEADRELARLPGMPLDIVYDGDRFVRRISWDGP